MTRLFLSLYAFITITLIVLSSVLGNIFFEDNEQDFTQKSLINSLEQLNQQSPISQEKLASIGLSGRLIKQADMPWSEQDINSFAANEAVLLYNDDATALLYLRQTSNTLLEVNLPSKPNQQKEFYWYSALFFILLAVGIAIWSWPLWRDLQALKSAAKQTDFNAEFKPSALKKRSLVYSIGQSLDELNSKVRELIQTQMELTGGVAHEFRTPLARLKFALEAVKTDDQTALLAIQQDIQELEKLMHEMLSYTSLEHQHPELNISQIPLLSLCQQRVSACTQGKNINIKISINGEDNIVLADDHYIARAFDNLFLNALRHAKSEIKINLSKHKYGVLLGIDDDGSGIDEAFHSKVFEPFFRPDNSRNRDRGGAGLGLAIVKRIAKWHECGCWLENSPLGGARFCLLFKQQNSQKNIS